MQGKTIRFLIKVVGSLSLAVGISQLVCVACAYVFGWNRISAWNWNSIAIHLLLGIQIALSVSFLYLAWIAWFGPIEKAVAAFSNLCAFSALLLIIGLGWSRLFERISQWIVPENFGNFTPFLGLFLVLAIFMSPFLLAREMHRRLKPWLLKRV